MSKKIKGIILAVVAIAVLVGVLIWVINIPDKDTEESSTDTSSSAEKQSSLIYDKDPADVKSLEISNTSGDYKIDRASENLYVIEDYAEVPLDNDRMSQIINKGASVTAQRTVAENAEDIDKYGFDNPRATVTVTFDDSSKTVKKLIIGNEVPSGDMSYFMVDGDNAVYAINNTDISYFIEDKSECADKILYHEYVSDDTEDKTDYKQIDLITINRKDLDYEMQIKYKQAESDSYMSCNYVISEPIEHSLEPTKSEKVLNGVFNLTADKIETVMPDEDKLKELGLDDPFATVSMKIPNGNGDFSLTVGNEYVDENNKSAGRYCMVNDINAVYIIANDNLPWITVTPKDIMSTLVFLRNINTVSEITVDTDDVDLKINATMDEEDNVSKVSVNGKDVSVDSYKSFYMYLISTPADNICLADVDGDPVATVTYSSEENGTDVIEFIPSDNRQTFVRVNGVVNFSCNTAYVDTLISNLKLISEGKEVVATW